MLISLWQEKHFV